MLEKKYVFSDNREQNTGEKFIKLSKICFPLEDFSAHFILIFKNNFQNLLDDRFGACHQFQAFQGFFQTSNFFLRSKNLSCSAAPTLTFW